MKPLLRDLSDQRFVGILQAEIDVIGAAHGSLELEDNDVSIPSDLKYQILHNSIVKYFSDTSDTTKCYLIDKIKSAVTESLEKNTKGPPYIKYSTYLSDKLHYSYAHLSNVFSKLNGITLERYIIAQRIEMVKKMLVQEGLGISEIAWKLGYCSVAHLSNQFKKITGSSPSSYKAKAQHDVHECGILCEPCKQRWMALLKQ